jgi:protein involved in polysaccharide export with SLBB domain
MYRHFGFDIGVGMNHLRKRMSAMVFASLLAAGFPMQALSIQTLSPSVAANLEGKSVAGKSTTSSTATPTTTSEGTATSEATTPATTSGVSPTEDGATAAALTAGDTIYLKISPPDPVEGVATAATQPVTPLPSTRIFMLDKNGVLELPYLGRFSLSGLSEEEAVLRLLAEPVLENYQIELRRLPVTKTGVDSLQPLGYNLFQDPTTFAPAEDVPVPEDYVIGTNDTVVVQLYGMVNETYTLVVTREGVIDIPEIGPVQVAGLTYAELKRNLSQRISKQKIGVQSHITMGPLRTITVFIMGDVTRPGSYTVNSLSTLTNALFVGGGVSPTGSLRNIQLKRSGRVITQFDLYALLLKGDNSADARLNSGDVIFVPPIGRTIAVSGEVRRPAIYELRRETTIEQVLALAGGLLPSAYPKGAQMQRVSGKQYRVLEDLDLNLAASRLTLVRDGDILDIPPLLDKMEEIVKLSGYVKRPGVRAWAPGMRVSDLVGSTRQLLLKPDLDYAVLRRHVEGAREVKIVSVRLGDALSDPASAANIELMRADELTVFGHEVVGDRQIKLGSIIAELERQATSAQPAKVVNIGGAIVEPGAYPLEADMRVTDLLRAAGSLKEEADSAVAELTRQSVVPGKGLVVDHVSVDLAKALQGDRDADLELKPKDFLIIKNIPEWSGQLTVELTGEVRNPGVYPISRGEKLRSVIERAGGLTGVAFPEGAVFTRDELQQKEEALFRELANRLETEMKATILERVDEAGRPQESSEVAKSVVDLLRNAKSEGRMVIDLPEILSPHSDNYDVTLLKGDKIFIPQRKDEVTVVGEVRKATTHLYSPAKSVDDYLGMSGGLTEKSKRKLVYIIRANGAAASMSTSAWWEGQHEDLGVRPGDTIVAMLDVEKVSKLKVWRDVVGSMGGLGSLLSGLANGYTAAEGQQIIYVQP